MSDFTDYSEAAIRDWMSQGSDMPTAPTNLFVALHTSDPGDAPDGSTEVSAGDYSREETAAGTDWDTTSGSGESFENASELNFGAATNDWGAISHISLWDGSGTGDNCLAAYALDSSKQIDTDDEAKFNAGEIDFTVS